MAPSKIRVFISHASEDAEVARSFITLIEGLFNIGNAELRCSSVPGYSFKGDDLLDKEILRDINEAVVVAIVSWQSLRKPYVWAELGAAWSISQDLIVCFLPGIRPEDLGGPWTQWKYYNFSNESAFAEFVDRLGHNGLTPRTYVTARSDDILRVFRRKILSVQNSSVITDRVLSRRQLKSEDNLRLSWRAIANYVKSDLLIIGWSAQNVISAGSSHFFKEIINKDITVTILVQNPASLKSCSSLGYAHICAKNNNEAIIHDIEKGLGDFPFYFSTLFNKSSKFKVFMTSELIAWSCVAIDRSLDSGLLQVEIYGYIADAESRPNFILRRSSKECYDNINGSIDRILNFAQPLNMG